MISLQSQFTLCSAECYTLLTALLNAILLTVILLNAILLNAILLNAILLNVVAPKEQSTNLIACN
jgi:hypothetical protein